MKNKSKILIAIVFVIAVGISFFAASYLKEQEHVRQRAERCKTYISFALDKIENKNMTDDGVMKALISNVYAAYECCDNSAAKGVLHDLWNGLIFEAQNYMENTNILIEQLEGVCEMLKYQ